MSWAQCQPWYYRGQAKIGAKTWAGYESWVQDGDPDC